MTDDLTRPASLDAVTPGWLTQVRRRTGILIQTTITSCAMDRLTVPFCGRYGASTFGFEALTTSMRKGTAAMCAIKTPSMIGLRAMVVGIVISVAAIAPVTAISTSAHAAEREMAVPVDKLTWVPFAQGTAQRALLWQNTPDGEYATLLKLPPGWTPGPHSHSADYHGVTLQGTWVHIFGADDIRSLPPGSYVMQPGKELHNDACAGPEECILFIHQHAPFDFTPAKAGGK